MLPCVNRRYNSNMTWCLSYLKILHYITRCNSFKHIMKGIFVLKMTQYSYSLDCLELDNLYLNFDTEKFYPIVLRRTHTIIVCPLFNTVDSLPLYIYLHIRNLSWFMQILKTLYFKLALSPMNDTLLSSQCYWLCRLIDWLFYWHKYIAHIIQ